MTPIWILLYKSVIKEISPKSHSFKRKIESAAFNCNFLPTSLGKKTGSAPLQKCDFLFFFFFTSQFPSSQECNLSRSGFACNFTPSSVLHKRGEEEAEGQSVKISSLLKTLVRTAPWSFPSVAFWMFLRLFSRLNKQEMREVLEILLVLMFVGAATGRFRPECGCKLTLW